MQYRSFATIISSGVIGLASLGSAAPTLQAQTRVSAEMSRPALPPTSLLSALSRYRAVRWATSTPHINCSPAPLTERPGAQAEYARPHVVPLEESFADAQSVKRSMTYRARLVAMENR
jgi:hypothetical protein